MLRNTPPFVFALTLTTALSTFASAVRMQDSDRARELAEANELTSQVIRLYSAKKYKDALPLARKVIDIRQRYLEANDTSLGSSYLNLGEIYYELNKDGEAEKAFTKALSVYEAQADAKFKPMTTALDRLADLRFRKNDYAGADNFLIRSLELKEKELGPENTETIASMKNFACLSLIAEAANYKLPEESDQKRGVLRSRAACWLGGFNADCAVIADSDRRPHGLLNGRAIRLVQPPYPPEALSQRRSGDIFVAIRIDKEGNVADAKPVCGGYAELSKAAIKAARDSKFTATLLNGQPVEVSGFIIYHFIGR